MRKNSSEYSYIRTPKDSFLDQNKPKRIIQFDTGHDFNDYPSFFLC